ncbi:MAG: hypothetical protein ACK2UK_07190, partial [Candidatus Promineifilaceae bacterium]
MVTELMAPEKPALSRAYYADTVRSWLWPATAVLLLAAVLRLAFLLEVPPGLAQDEVLNADVAGFIRQGAHALFFREGYGHEALYHYWSVPFQVLLGDNALAIRLPSVALGILLVALTLRWTRRAFDPIAALAAGALMAVSWWPIIFSRIGIRPIMEPVFLLLFAWFWPRRPWLAGLFIGLSLYTYTAARVLFLWPLLLGLYWFLFRKRLPAEQINLKGRPFPQPMVAAGVVLLVMALLFLPLWLTLRADPSLQQRVEQLQGPLLALQSGELSPALANTLATAGVFSFTGDPRWTYMIPGQPLFNPLTAALFYGGLLLALWRFKQPAYAFLLFWLLVGMLPSALTPEAPSTIRLVGALPAVYVLPGLAVSWLWQRGSASTVPGWARGALVILFAAVLLLAAGRTIIDGFVRWPQALETRLKYQTVLLDMARYLRQGQEGTPVFADGFYRPITVDALRRDLNQDLRGRWVQSGAEVAGAVVLPVEGDGRLYVPEFAAPDEMLLAAAGVAAEPLYRSAERPSFAVYALPSAEALPRLQEAVPFEGNLSLVGYEITTPQIGQAIQIVTVWQVEGALPDVLAVFVNWLDDV